MIQPWEKQIGEPEIWFKRFHKYLHSQGSGPTGRSALGVYNEERSQADSRKAKKRPPAVSVPQSWAKASQEWKWQERAQQYDVYEREEFNKKMSQRREDLIRRRLALSDKAHAQALTILDLPIVQQRIEQDGRTIIIEPTPGINKDTAIRLAELADKMECKGLGINEDDIRIRLHGVKGDDETKDETPQGDAEWLKQFEPEESPKTKDEDKAPTDSKPETKTDPPDSTA